MSDEIDLRWVFVVLVLGFLIVSVLAITVAGNLDKANRELDSQKATIAAYDMNATYGAIEFEIWLKALTATPKAP